MINMLELSEKLTSIKALIHQKLDSYDTGLNGIDLHHSDDPEGGDMWSFTLTVNMRKFISQDEFHQSQMEAILLIHTVFPEFKNFTLHINPLWPKN